MNTANHNTAYDFPFDLSWSPQDLADAVPLRLSELLDFDAGSAMGNNQASANGVLPLPRPAALRDYLPTPGFHSSFLIR